MLHTLTPAILLNMKKKPTPRTLHLVDIENLLGDARPNDFRMRAAWEQYRDLLDLSEPNQVIIACNHGAACVVGCCIGSVGRLLVRSGENGADKALIDVLVNEGVERRFSHLVIASGDGIFTERVAELTSAGVFVTVVARRNSLSKQLKMAATKVIYFEPIDSSCDELAVVA